MGVIVVDTLLHTLKPRTISIGRRYKYLLRAGIDAAGHTTESRGVVTTVSPTDTEPPATGPTNSSIQKKISRMSLKLLGCTLKFPRKNKHIIHIHEFWSCCTYNQFIFNESVLVSFVKILYTLHLPKQILIG